MSKKTIYNIEQITAIRQNNSLTWPQKVEELKKEVDVTTERSVMRVLKRIGVTNYSQPILAESPQLIIAKKRKTNKLKKRFIITWAQNQTPVHKQFLKNIESYAKFIDAEIHVIAGRYKNPTSVFQDREHEVWAEETLPYLDCNRHSIHPNMMIMSDIKISPTAVNPLNSLEGLSKNSSCIFGHPRIHMQMIPTIEGYTQKLIQTTGAITLRNYTDSKMGKKGEFHHQFGFIIVEIKDNKICYTRQVIATADGSFIDLYYEVKNEEINRINQIDACVMGDLHLGEEDKKVIESTKKLLNELQPKKTIIHDLFEGKSISHHSINNPFDQYKKQLTGQDTIKDEIKYMLDWLNDMKRYNLVIVASNHCDFIDKYMVNYDWKRNIQNALEYMTYGKLMLEGKINKGIINYVIEQKFGKQIKTLTRLDSFKVDGWELAQHGDMGANGSRGSITTFRKLNTKIITGHSHSPGRVDNVVITGTSTKLRMGYNNGVSSWGQAHVIIHKNSKTQHILFDKNGDFTTFK